MTITREFHLKVLGRTLEHLGVQMYKRRDTAVAELVANCWDAGATVVEIEIPASDYSPENSELRIMDNGSGMSDDDVEDHYLVLGRNRRAEGDPAPPDRPVMGRKGIGKLAGFGIARVMDITTWTDSRTTSLTLDLDALKTGDGDAADIPLEGTITEGQPDDAIDETGTKLTLRTLKHAGPLDVDRLHEALARRFSRTVQGSMEIRINGEALRAPNVDFEFRVPEEADAMQEDTLSDGGTVRYWYGFSKKVLQSAQMRGFTVLVNGKTAQAPNYFFDVEGTASGQHGTKYLTGVIEADYLDSGADDESDLISTDRQEIDWENDLTQPLHEWGDRLTRDALAERSRRRGDEAEKRVYDLPEFKERIDRLEADLQKRVKQYLRVLGEADAEDDKMLQLADSLIRAFEYRHFHDVVNDIDAAGTSPDDLHKLLDHLREWKVLESRAILEIVNGRLEITDKFAQMLAEDAPETAHQRGQDNLHDLLAEYPWIVNPEWQVLNEEKRITTQVREWGFEEEGEEDGQRYDFLALDGEGQIILIEIKRPGHPVELDEVARLDEYAVKLERAHGNAIKKVLISGGVFNFSFDRTDIESLQWDAIQVRTRSFYEHYRAVLEGRIDDPGFDRKEGEVHRTRHVLESGTVWRGEERRKRGLGAQDVEYPPGEHADPDDGSAPAEESSEK